MKEAANERFCSFLRGCICVLLVPATGITLVLWTTTGRPSPPTVVPWEELGFRYWTDWSEILKDRVPRFCCFSACGRYYALVALTSKTGNRDTLDLRICQVQRHQTICTIRGLTDAPSSFRLSPDEKLVQVEWHHRLVLYSWPSGEEKQTREAEAIRVPIAGTYNELAPLWAIVGANLRKLEEVKSRVARGPLGFDRAEFCAIFYDRQDRIKAVLADTKSLEVWDVQTQLQEWQIAVPYASPENLIVLPDRERFVLIQNHEIQIRSLEDGTVIASFPQNGSPSNLKFSPDSRFLLFNVTDVYDLLRLVPCLSGRMANSKGIHNPAVLHFGDAVLLDVQTGRSWPKMHDMSPRSALTTVRDDNPRMICVNVDGWYEWTIPPKWRWFSAWALYAQCLWLILFIAWRSLRMPKPVIRNLPSNAPNNV